MSPMDERIQLGTQFAEHIWWSFAQKIVLLAATLYKWDEDEWRIANDKFLRPNDYKVIMED